MVQQFQIKIPAWPVEQMTGYKPITTFWQDFSIADRFGINGIKSTFIRAFHEWKSNYKYLTELVMVLNHKIAYHYNPEKGAANVLANLYNELWEKADNYANENLKDEEYAYFYHITD